MADIIEPDTRRVLDILGTSPHSDMIEWRPVEDDPTSVTVVWSDETASKITVTSTPDPIRED